MKTRRLGSMAIASALLGGVVIAGAGSASAHTPSISASCSGVRVNGTAYDAGQDNRWTVTVDGVTTKGTFGAGVDKTVPVPQEGRTTQWSATIEAFDGGYRQSRSGSVGPCGTPPVPDRPADKVETRERVTPPDCTTFTVTTVKESRTIPWTYDKASNAWVAGTPGAWVQTASQSREATSQECVRPPEPESSEHREVASTPDCTTYTVTTQEQVRDGVFVFEQGAWKQDGFGPWRTVASRSSAATLQQCPAPPQPEPLVRHATSEKQACGDDVKTVSTTTTTTPFVLDEATRTWNEGEPVVVTTTAKERADTIECPVPAVDRGAVLPATGAPSWWYGAAAGLLLACGGALVMFQRRSLDWD